MPYQLTWEPRGVYREYFGDVSIAERRASFDAICADPRFDRLLYSVTDYTAVRDYEVTEIATAEIAALHVAPVTTNPYILIAAATDRPDIIAAIDDFMSHRFTTTPYRVFPTLAEARRWIGHELTPGA